MVHTAVPGNFGRRENSAAKIYRPERVFIDVFTCTCILTITTVKCRRSFFLSIFHYEMYYNYVNKKTRGARKVCMQEVIGNNR